MDERISPDDLARMALTVFKHFGSRPKDALRADNFANFAPRRSWAPEDVLAGVQHGKVLGWFEDGPSDSVRLTSAGYVQIGLTTLNN